MTMVGVDVGVALPDGAEPVGCEGGGPVPFPAVVDEHPAMPAMTARPAMPTANARRCTRERVISSDLRAAARATAVSVSDAQRCDRVAHLHILQQPDGDAVGEHR
ncbi:MAG: hypothetical protein DLM56_01390 [Pseudonocardiales bacterium]|nr:MAG: hypothetical protein DLM56_01390 [Pseudonocardiales bacterium]